MAWRVAQDIEDGKLVNLGMGMPVEAANHIPADRDVFLQSENGVIGVGPLAAEDEANPNLVDASSRRVTLRPGGSIVDSVSSFAMIRGGHIDVTVLGAFEVAANGDLANWDSRAPDRGPLVGGAMDLAACAREVWVIMAHNTRSGAPRLLDACTLPLTARACVTRVYTDIAVIDVTPDGFVAREVVAGIDAQQLQARSQATITWADDCKELVAPDL
jgi:3-oxoadipate CoA-transferase beta subunit